MYEYMMLYTSDDFSGTMKECDEGELVWIDKKEIDDWIRNKKPTKWDELGVTPESIPIDFNETVELMKERAALSRTKNLTHNDKDNDYKRTTPTD